MNCPANERASLLHCVVHRVMTIGSKPASNRIRAIQQSRRREQIVQRICAGWDVGLGVVIAGGTVAMFAQLLDSTLGIWLRTWVVAG